jgi:ribosomal protein S18 acetylase RimI-like enzyme
MPPLTEPAAIRAVLQTDPVWGIYALGDLAPGFFEKCRWFNSPGLALVMYYHGFDPPVLFALGDAGAVSRLLDEAGYGGDLYLHVRPEIVPLVRQRQHVTRLDLMRRMSVDARHFKPVAPGDVRRLTAADLPALERLYADGKESGESPHFFLPSMVEQGVYYGVAEGDELVAAAGTHIVVPDERMAALGNIYTRRDRRNQGLASRVTSAVASELFRQGFDTLALNVNQQNHSAFKVYDRLGFTQHCFYYEGEAVRRQASSG